MRGRGEPWLRWSLVAISVATVVSGAVQLIAPGFELEFLRAESTPTSRHFFGIVGMFMVLFGGLLLHALVRPKENPAAFVWAGLQKLGACVAVSLGVARGIFSPLALGVAGFDLLSGLLILGYLGLLRRSERVALSPPLKSAPKAPPPTEPRPVTSPLASSPTEDGRKRALILAGGGMRVAWQAGVVRALQDAGLRFTHGDGTSGGIINLAMLLSGQSPAEMCDRWRTLRVKDFVSFVSPEKYLKAWDMEAMGDADGIREHVFPHLGINVDAIRAHTAMQGTFNVCDFTRKTNEAIPHTRVDLDLLVAGISLPIFMPPVRKDGALPGLRLDPGRQPARSGAARGPGALGAVVHRQHAHLPARGVPPVRPHDRAQRQRRPLRTARAHPGAQRPHPGRRGGARPPPAHRGPPRQARAAPAARSGLLRRPHHRRLPHRPGVRGRPALPRHTQ